MVEPDENHETPLIGYMTATQHMVGPCQCCIKCDGDAPEDAGQAVLHRILQEDGEFEALIIQCSSCGKETVPIMLPHPAMPLDDRITGWNVALLALKCLWDAGEMAEQSDHQQMGYHINSFEDERDES